MFIRGFRIAIDSQDQFGVVGKQDQGHEQSNRDENGEAECEDATMLHESVTVKTKL